MGERELARGMLEYALRSLGVPRERARARRGPRRAGESGRHLMMPRAESDALWLSLSVAARSVAFNLPFAILVAWLLTRTRFAGRTLFDAFVHLPLVLPPVVVGYLLLVLFGVRGPIGGWLYEHFGIQLAFTSTGAALATAVMSFPLVVRAIRISLEERRSRPRRCGAHARRRPVRPVLLHHAAADRARHPRRRGHRVRGGPRRVRRGDHLRVQHSRRDAHAAAGAVHGAADAGRRRARRAPRAHLAVARARGSAGGRIPEPRDCAARLGRRMSMLRVELRKRRGDFSLDAALQRARRRASPRSSAAPAAASPR